MTDRDDKGREWAGDRHRQMAIAAYLNKFLSNEDPVDVAGAVGTVVANTICDWSLTKEDALKGFEAWCGDMREVIEDRFKKKGALS